MTSGPTTSRDDPPAALPAANREDAALVAACAAGDAAAWERFVDRYGALLMALARRRLALITGRARDADVQDVVAEVYMALLRRDRHLLHNYNPAYRVSTYLGVICRTEVARLLRRARRQPLDIKEAERIEEPPGRTGPLRALEEKERTSAIKDIHAALPRLRDRDQLLITLRYFDGLDYAAIAEVVAVSPESVGQLLHRAKQRLAKHVPHLAGFLAPPETRG